MRKFMIDAVVFIVLFFPLWALWAYIEHLVRIYVGFWPLLP